MDNVSSTIEIQHPKPDIQPEKSNTELRDWQLQQCTMYPQQ